MSVPSGSHILSKFDEDLTELNNLVLRMGGLVEEQLAGAIDALVRADAAKARQIVEGDREIDRIELRSDEEVAHLLALRSPLGVDLRSVLTLAKTVSDLERVGDEAKKIARTVLRLVDQGTRSSELPFLDAIQEMGGIGRSMLHDTLNALVRHDVRLAAELIQEDRRLDQLCKQVYAEVKALVREQPERVDAAFETVFAAKSLERIGDHAKNIGSYIHYLVEGRDIRHPAVNPG